MFRREGGIRTKGDRSELSVSMCGRSREGRLTKVIDSFFQATDYDTGVNFCDYLNFHGINPVFRETKDGTVHGITLVDYRKGSVINGRDLGNPFSGQALLKRVVATASRVEDIPREISNLMNAKTYYPDSVSPYLKRKKRKRYPVQLY